MTFDVEAIRRKLAWEVVDAEVRHAFEELFALHEHHHGIRRLIMAVTISDKQQVTLTLTGTDADGKPANLTGSSPSWTASDPSIAALTPSADGTSVVVKPGGNLGTATITASISGGLSANDTVTVTGSAPTALSITEGQPEPLS